MNNREQRFSDEFLNAFVDDQLAAEEKGRVYIEIARDESLNRQVCELRKLHELVKLAYQNPPAPPVRTHVPARRSYLRFGVAASLLLMVGALIGAQLELLRPAHAPVATGVTPAATASQPKTTLVAPARPTATVGHGTYDNSPSKVLIHVARDGTTQLGEALDEVEDLLHHYRNSHQNARVQVVINGKGMELVRVDTSAFADRIQQLQREFDNLTFAACQNTIDRLAREQGIIVRLLPGVVTIDSGMAEIMRRQNQGWTYLQV